MSGLENKSSASSYEEVLLEVRRVTRVTTGGRRLSFRATVLIGNRQGSIGIGTAKGVDVTIAVQKATHQAYKNIFSVPIARGYTVPYAVVKKFKSAVVKLIPASAGTGIKAGSAVRIVLQLAGYENVLSKMIGTNNKLNNALATIYALAGYKYPSHFSILARDTLNTSMDTSPDIQNDISENQSPSGLVTDVQNIASPKQKRTTSSTKTTKKTSHSVTRKKTRVITISSEKKPHTSVASKKTQKTS